MDSIIRIVGALSLWPIEILMQMRIFALYKCSLKVSFSARIIFLWASVLSGPQVALINAVLFLASIGIFLWILIFNAMRRRDVIANAIHYPLPGCPSVHSGIEWAQWVPGE